MVDVVFFVEVCDYMYDNLYVYINMNYDLFLDDYYNLVVLLGIIVLVYNEKIYYKECSVYVIVIMGWDDIYFFDVFVCNDMFFILSFNYNSYWYGGFFVFVFVYKWVNVEWLNFWKLCVSVV